MQIKTNAIVLKQRNIGENDKILTILSDTQGLLEVSARRAKSTKSRLAAASQVLSYSSMCLFEGKTTATLDSAEMIESFFDIRLDIVKLSLAGYFAELVAYLSPTQDNAGEFLRLLLNSLHILEKEKLSAAQLKAVFELRAASIGGFMPNLLGCKVCGAFESDDFFFLPQEGVLCCQHCLAASGFDMEYTIKFLAPVGVVAAMRHIVFSEFQKIFSFKLPNDTLKQLCFIAEQYVLFQTEGKFKSLEMYHSFLKNEVKT